jgi:hypothetical protein
MELEIGLGFIGLALTKGSMTSVVEFKNKARAYLQTPLRLPKFFPVG